ncbi:helix-turn-helix domain-containing protein [Flavobacterium selenitireducens]|uniref:helix-turn-helix domain-containing protein n=1 Tax=Flavobacterium selenitireducens TaxID=2722704 RepID=UPI00168AD8C0|nr:helix-turn-helix domain-containing protein [Flavobacterium selenitireducens]MBD3581945.1 helix-turn-helix domain-containing protein [Flavobacterium selenitireducens]
MIDSNLFESSLKTLGLIEVNLDSATAINEAAYQSYIKIFYLPKGYEITVDFGRHETLQPSLLFVAPNQFLKIDKVGEQAGHLIFYNRDFYCIEIHDAEVACDGLLFNNIQNMPLVRVGEKDNAFVSYLFGQMQDEFQLNDVSLEEMIRTYLKQVLIKATRMWKSEHLDNILADQNGDLEFYRKFTLLVDANYRNKHSVADYADLLCMAPKTITHKCKRLNLPQPNEIIKNRIVLEAKRLLIHTALTAKEIAYDLGYEDPAYFSRLFLAKTGTSPSGFRSGYRSKSIAQ